MHFGGFHHLKKSCSSYSAAHPQKLSSAAVPDKISHPALNVVPALALGALQWMILCSLFHLSPGEKDQDPPTKHDSYYSEEEEMVVGVRNELFTSKWGEGSQQQNFQEDHGVEGPSSVRDSYCRKVTIGKSQ